MPQIVDAHFKSVASQLLPERLRNFIAAFGNEIKRRTKSQPHLERHQLPRAVHAALALDVMGQHQRESLPLRPARPIRRRLLGTRRNRPDMLDLFALAQRQPAPRREPQRQREDRLDPVIDSVSEHSRFWWNGRSNARKAGWLPLDYSSFRNRSGM